MRLRVTYLSGRVEYMSFKTVTERKRIEKRFRELYGDNVKIETVAA